MEKLQVKMLDVGAIVPTYGSAEAIGLDLYANVPKGEVVVHPSGVTKIHTGVSIRIPEGHYGRIAPRSGLAYRDGIQVLGGVIDRDYTGELMVLLTTCDTMSVILKHGDRVAQLIIEKAARPEIEEVEALSSTGRGVEGFGSTGA